MGLVAYLVLCVKNNFCLNGCETAYHYETRVSDTKRVMVVCLNMISKLCILKNILVVCFFYFLLIGMFFTPLLFECVLKWNVCSDMNKTLFILPFIKTLRVRRWVICLFYQWFLFLIVQKEHIYVTTSFIVRRLYLRQYLLHLA